MAIRLLEIKTSHTRYVGDVLKSIPTVQQASKYLAEASDVFGDLVTESLWRVIRKFGGKTEGIDPQDWIERCRKDMQKRPEFYFHELLTVRSAAQQERWRREAWEAQRRYLRLEAGGFPLRNTAHCTSYGGCAFRGICAGDLALDGFAVREHKHPELAEADGEIEPLTHTMIKTLLECEELGRLVFVENLEVPESPALSLGSAVHRGFELMDPDAAVEHLRELRADDLEAAEVERTIRDAGMVRAMVEGGIKWWDEWPPFREVEYRLPLVNPDTGATSRRFQLSGSIDGVWADSLPGPAPGTSKDQRSILDRGVYAHTAAKVER